jgi:hypothetical protein
VQPISSPSCGRCTSRAWHRDASAFGTVIRAQPLRAHLDAALQGDQAPWHQYMSVMTHSASVIAGPWCTRGAAAQPGIWLWSTAIGTNSQTLCLPYLFAVCMCTA